jgi:hypothetical protein
VTRFVILRAVTRLVILRAVTRFVILRAVAGSTPANDVAAGVDSATARGMTWLDGRLRDDAMASRTLCANKSARSTQDCVPHALRQ